MGTTCVLHYVFNSMRGWMEKDVLCRLECPWFGGCLEITVLTVIAVWCPYSKWYVYEKKNHLCARIYHQQFGLCLMAINFLFLSVRTTLLCTLTTKTVFLQTAKNSSQELQTTCQAQISPIIRSQKASSMTSSGISNFQKEGRTFGIKVTTAEFATPLSHYILNWSLRRIL